MYARMSDSQSMDTDEKDSQTRPMLPAEQEAAQAAREKRIGQGIAMLSDGATYREAQAATGLSTSVLHRYFERICSGDSEPEKNKIDGRIVAYAAVNATLAGEEISRRLSDPEKLEKITERDLTTIYGVHTDKVATKRRWSRPDDTAGEDFLGKLAAGLSRVKSVRIEINDPADKAIDVTPTSSSSG